MNDQAAVLRKLVKNRYPAVRNTRCQLIAVTSGKGGVGKTNTTVNLALAVCRAGKKVAILDADFGLANVDVLLGLNPKYHIGHVIGGIQPLKSIIIQGPEGIDILPASSGLQDLVNLSEGSRERLILELNEVLMDYDFLFIDTAPGISSNVIRFLMVARSVIVVAVPEPTSLVDAYALMKVLFSRDPQKEVFLLVNSAQDEVEARGVHRHLTRVSSQYLGHRVAFLGSIPHDKRVSQSVRRQQPFLSAFPRTVASRRFGEIARKLIDRPGVAGQFEQIWAWED